MNYQLISDTIKLIEEFEDQARDSKRYPADINGFKHWIIDKYQGDFSEAEPNWVGKEKGRSPESVINTLIVRMNQYAKSYSKSVIHDSDFSTQEDFIFLITLKTFGAMTKMELIKQNVQEKSVGMLIINRLIKQEFVDQTDSKKDRRSKIVSISDKGIDALERLMDKIRQATSIVTGDLEHAEKMELIHLLQKLDDFHRPIYDENIDVAELLDAVQKNFIKN